MSRAYDIVIFGATGFTGKHTIPQVEKLSKENGRNYSWAVAGRSESKLLAVLKEMGDKIGKDLSKTPLIIADVNDVQSLANMAMQARIIINTCGPYKFFGEPVVKACVENGCHHVDVSGEPFFIENMQLKYHEEAQKKGVYIISACGFDSVPADLGLMYLRSQFDGTLNSVETYLTSGVVGGPYPGPSINYGTWESAVHGVGAFAELKDLRRKLYPTKLPKFNPKLSLRGAVHKCSFNNKYALPFMGSDRSVMQRTQRYLYEEEKLRPVQVGTYFCVDSIISILIMAVMGGIFMTLSKFEFGRNLLLKYPGFFSLGFFSHEGPSDEKMQNTKFAITLIGEGWSTKQDDCNADFPTSPDKKVIAQVNGTNPGYGATCMALTLCALTILDDPAKLPKKGGVYSPGATFHNTSIIKELHKNGLTFEVVEKK